MAEDKKADETTKSAPNGTADTAAATAGPPKPDLTAELRTSLSLLSKAVGLSEPRYTNRVLRPLTTLRKRVHQEPDGEKVLKQTIEVALPKHSKVKDVLLPLLSSTAPAAMEIDGAAKTLESIGTQATAAASSAPTPKDASPLPDPNALPEHETFLSLLTILLLLDRATSASNDAGLLTEAFQLSTRLTTEYLVHQNRRSLDSLAAKVWFYHSRLAELLETTSADRHAGAWDALRPSLLAAHRTATLRRDEDTQATALNLLVRNYLGHDLWDQADRLVGKSEFPEFGMGSSVGVVGHVPPGQVARWLYYIGRIRAVQLNYTESHTHLQQAIRRAPAPKVAPGFYQTVHKLFVSVVLLMGDIPDRSLFRHPVLRHALRPYFCLVQTVRAGDVAQFETVLTEHGPQFVADQTYTLILRLRHNVLKTALRTLSLAYSRIPLREVCRKLHLDSEEDAEYVVAKAVRDGVIEATLDHEKGYMKGREVVDVYATNEPQQAFHERISFCLKLHNESVRAMRFPLNAHKKELASAEEARERERELANDIMDGDEPDGDDPDPEPGQGF